MKIVARMLCIWIILGPAQISWGLLAFTISDDDISTIDNRREYYTDVSFEVFPSYSKLVADDYTMLSVVSGEGVISGGPFQFGTPMAGIIDWVGPDLHYIIAFLESRDYFEQLPLLGLRSVGSIGKEFGLWPQSLWFVRKEVLQTKHGRLLQLTAVPEPSTIGLFILGIFIIGCSFRIKRIPA